MVRGSTMRRGVMVARVAAQVITTHRQVQAQSTKVTMAVAVVVLLLVKVVAVLVQQGHRVCRRMAVMVATAYK